MDDKYFLVQHVGQRKPAESFSEELYHEDTVLGFHLSKMEVRALLCSLPLMTQYAPQLSRE